jgi:hypothetical protein
LRIHERPIDTLTVKHLKSAIHRSRDRPYVFVLTDQDLVDFREAGLRLPAALAYACIKGAVRAAGGVEWVALRQRTTEAVGRNAKWWHEQTQRLERAGFIECQRKRGRTPRYRLAPVRSRTATESGETLSGSRGDLKSYGRPAALTTALPT